jgi:GNAT superfamily N-acetyltransferase
MSTLAQDEITEINEAVSRRWRSIDPLLPEPGNLPREGCGTPLKAAAKDGSTAGLAVCRHQRVGADELAQTWNTATRFTLTMRLREADTQAAADDLLTQWHRHLADLPEAPNDDTSAVVTWPSRDVTGVRALQRHGLQPVTVIAVRRSGLPAPEHGETQDLVIRHAEPADEDVVTEFELGVIHYDAHFGGAFPRPATPALTREATRQNLQHRPEWTWLAERRGRPVGLAVVEPPAEAEWIAGLARQGRTAYLPSMFLSPEERGTGTGAKLIAHVHDALDASGIDLTLLHYAQLNPLSGPFWHRMGYRPLWSTWAALPASTLR